MKEDEIVNLITYEDLPDNLKFVADNAGLQAVKQLIIGIPGLTVYVPRLDNPKLVRPYVIKRINECVDTTHLLQKLVMETRLAESTLRKMIDELLSAKLLNKNPLPVLSRYHPVNQDTMFPG
ncbi:MAG: hypothetical protein M9949_05980 [Candidatus Kapabacteria bacterium]|nr:hypothetical protein [Candidatus Kapabacteria bacterium]